MVTGDVQGLGGCHQLLGQLKRRFMIWLDQ
jgi:hypothetical protein